MKKIVYLMFLVALTFTSCDIKNKVEGSSNSNNTSSLSSTSKTQENTEGTGGKEPYGYSSLYDEKFTWIDDGYVISENIDLVAWNKEIEEEMKTDKTKKWEFNKYNYIKRFNISIKDFKGINDQEHEEQFRLSSEEIDILYTSNTDLIKQTFKHPNDMYVNKIIYTPEWIDTHTSEDYEKAGITKEILKNWYAKIEKESIGIDKYKESLKQKVSSYEAYEKTE